MIPRALVDKEIGHRRVADMRVVESMHERKALMAELADAFVALPGGLGTLEDRCVSPDLPLDPTREALVREGRPRLAVVAEDGRLLGLLCLKRSQSGFCTDDGVAQMRRSRQKE